MSGKICAFNKCTNNKRRHPDLSFFSFPSSKKYGTADRLQQWVKNAGLRNNLPDEVYKSNLVCSKHFERWCFANYLCKRLIQTAVPTISTEEVIEREKNGTLPIQLCERKSGDVEEDDFSKNDEECDAEPELFRDKKDSLEDSPERFTESSIEYIDDASNIINEEQLNEISAKWVPIVTNTTTNCRTYSKKTPINVIAVSPIQETDQIVDEKIDEADAVTEAPKRKFENLNETGTNIIRQEDDRQVKRKKHEINGNSENRATHVEAKDCKINAKNLTCVETFVIQELKNLEEMNKSPNESILDSNQEIKDLSAGDTNQEMKQLQQTEKCKEMKLLKTGQFLIVKSNFELMDMKKGTLNKNNPLLDKKSDTTLHSPIFSTRQTPLKIVTDQLKKRVQNRDIKALKIIENKSDKKDIAPPVVPVVNNNSSYNPETRIAKLREQLKFYKSQCLRKSRTIRLLNAKLRKRNLKDIIKIIPVSEERKTFAKMQLKQAKIWSSNEKDLALNLHQRFPVSLKYMRDKMGFRFPTEDRLNGWIEEMNSDLC